MRAALAGCAALIAIAIAFSPAAAAETVTRAIDPAASRAEFSVQHVWVERVTGSLPITHGSVSLESGSLIPTKVIAVLDATKLRTADDDRDGVLQTADWFDTKAFPTWTFVSTAVTANGPSSFALDGDLTLHGVTRSERLNVTISGDAAHPVYRATGHLDRHAFGMHRVKLDPAIGEIVDVTLTIALQR